MPVCEHSCVCVFVCVCVCVCVRTLCEYFESSKSNESNIHTLNMRPVATGCDDTCVRNHVVSYVSISSNRSEIPDTCALDVCD
jgi:hypothetical protein